MPEERIGVLIETGDADLLSVLSADKARAILADREDVVVLEAENGLAAEQLSHRCRQLGLSKLVVCGPSSATCRLPDCLAGDDPAQPVPVICAAIRDHCAWVETDTSKGSAKAARLLEIAVERARGTATPMFAEVDVDRTVAVIGGNHAAHQMAAALTDEGFPVVLLLTEPPSGCFYPLSDNFTRQVLTNPLVRVIEGAAFHRLTGCVGAFRLGIATDAGPETISAGAVIIAVDAQSEPCRLGAGLDGDRRIISLRDYGELLQEERLNGEQVCVWLDRQGPERRCAGQAALRFSLEHVRRGGHPTVLFSHATVYGHTGQKLYDDARTAGVRFIRCDGAAPTVSLTDRGVTVSVADSVLPEHALELAADLLVVPATVAPSEHHEELARILHQPLDSQGYLQSGNVKHRPVGSARPGIFFIGGCHDECDPDDARVEAQAVLAEMLTILPNDTVLTPTGKVVIDPGKCAACLTCVRACPHGAMQVRDWSNRMDFFDPACYQCGICVASCPGRALEHSSFPSEQMHRMLKVATSDLLGQAPIIAFACQQSAVPAASGAGREGLALPADVLLIEVPCAGLVGENLILDALEQGAKTVLVLGCHHDNCRSLKGSDLTRKKAARVDQMLREADLGENRVQFFSLAANESHRLVHILDQVVDGISATVPV
jgi:heterodisulfide reductase subunit A-like polyferredoxin/coenzyme F420-reducing hydrogenase delta subunit